MHGELNDLLNDLGDTCSGRVLTPSDAEYAEAVRGHLTSVARRPSLVLRAASAADISAALRCAGTYGATVGVLATGHAARHLPDPDLLVVTSALRGVEIDPTARVARIEAGATWGEVLALAEPHGVIPLSGSHASVGAVGYTLGGGLGPLARSHGYAADHVRSFEIVTAAGEHRVVDSARDPELFRALCGSGREGLAVVTAMTIGLVPSAGVFAGHVVFDAVDVPHLFRRYADWTRRASTALTSSLSILRIPGDASDPGDTPGRTLVQLDLCHTGSAAEAEATCAELSGWGAVIRSDLRSRPLSELVVDDAPGPGWGGAIGLTELSEPAITAIVRAVGPSADVPFVLAQVRHVGGALRGADTPVQGMVAGRDPEYLFFLIGEPVPELIDGPIPERADAIFASLGEWSVDDVPTNFADHLSRVTREHAMRPERRDALATLRAVWDPAGMFRYWAG